MARAQGVDQTQPKAILSCQLAMPAAGYVYAGQIYELLIIPQGNQTWRFELCNLTVGAAIPRGFKLQLLTEDLQPFPNNEDIAITAVKQLLLHTTMLPILLSTL